MTDDLNALSVSSRLAEVLESIHDVVVAFDREWRFVYMNAAAERYYGAPRDTMLGRSFWDVVPECVGSIYERELRQAAADGSPRYFEAPGVRRRDRWLEVATLPSPSGVTMHFHDITDRKRLELVLAEGRTQLQTILDSAPLYLAHCDRDRRYRFVNQRYAERFGLTPAEVVGRRISDVIGEQAYALIRDYVDTALAGEPVEFEVEVPYEALGTRTMHCTYVPEATPDGAVLGLVATIVDVTERQRAERALERQRRLVDTIANNATLGLFMMDERQHCTYMNPAAEQITGFSFEEVKALDRPLHDIVHHTHPDGTPYPMEECPIDRALPQKAREQGEDIFVHKNGSFYPVAFTASPILENGVPVGTVIEVEDITDRKRAEREREALLAREQEASRAKDEFLAVVSHELRTPLNSMLGWVRMLRSGQLDEATKTRALETIERNTVSQAQLIEDLLDVSRIITGRLRIKVQPVDLPSVIGDAVNSMRPAADAKGVRLQVILDSYTGTLLGDPERLQQVVWNLVSNAVKFTPRGGRVQVHLERINSHVEVTVSDTGTGLAPEFLPHVFDRFSQADSTTTRAHGGLGLGLAIARHLVEMHGGTIHASSAGKGLGSTFTIKLPLTIARAGADDEERVHAAARDALPFAAEPVLEGLDLVVVDDEEDTRELLEIMLGSCGARVRVAASGVEALEEISARQPDVLVSDVGMPEMDGYAVIARVREGDASRGRYLPAIALTAYARAEDRVRLLAAGYDAHLTKPVEPAELAAVIARLARRAP